MIRIIPAIDIIDEKCVRLSQGDYDQKKVYSENVVEIARKFEEAGIEHIHVVDLDGAKSKHIVNAKALKEIASETGLEIDFRGGIKTDEDISTAFQNGAKQVTVGSIAVQRPDLFISWLQKYGAERIILGADMKDGFISVNGWKEGSTKALIPFLESYVKEGIQYVLCTDISKDGMLKGPSIQLYKDIMTHFPTLKLIASGGVSSMKDIEELDKAGIYAVVTGKAIYENKITLEEIVDYIKTHKN